MRKLLALCSFLCLSAITTGQIFIGDVSFSNQAEVDAFVAAQPGTTTIEGSFYLNFSSPGGFDLSALNTLEAIQSIQVEGYLHASFESFSNQLTSISSGNITFSACTVEIPLTVFSTISSCATLELNASGESLTFPTFTSIGKVINTETSTSICSFPLVNTLNQYWINSPVNWQFPALTHIRHAKFQALSSFPENETIFLGMEAVHSFDTLSFMNNQAIHFAINPLLNIQEVGNLNIAGYTYNHLQNLVTNLTSVQLLQIVGLQEESVIPDFPSNLLIDNLIIGFNFHITEMDGLADVHFNESIYIEHNESLQVCNVESICSFLASGTGFRYIAYNKLGCNSLNEVSYACEHPETVTFISGQLFIDMDCNGIFDGADVNCGINPIALYTAPEFVPAMTMGFGGMYSMAIPLNAEINYSTSPLVGFDTQSISINTGNTPEIIENLNLSICPTTAVQNIGVNTYALFEEDDLSWHTRILVTNYAASIESGELSITFNTPLVDGYYGSVPGITYGNTITFSFENLLPFQTQMFTFRLHFSPDYVPGDPLPFTCSATPANGIDSDWTNNQLSGVMHLYYSYDPNEISVNRNQIHFDDVADGEPEELVYTVRFQNTGTAQAYHVRVKDVLEADLDISTIEMIEASHNYFYTIVGDTLTWHFENIYLPDSTTNEPESHGWFTFKIKTKGNHTIASQIENSVAIYFDLNEPVITNTAQTTFYDCLPEFNISGSTALCAGEEAIFTLPEENYTTIEWFVNGEMMSTENELAWTFMNEGTTAIEVQAYTDLCYYTHSLEVIVHPTPSFNVNVWGTAISTFPVQESYMWYFEDQLIPDATDFSYNATESGTYAVVGMNEFGCYQNSTINFELCPPVPDILGNPNFCGSAFQSLYTPTEYPNMNWYLDDQYFGFGMEFFGAVNTPGTHIITLSVGNDLCMTDNQIEITATGTPQISLTDGVLSTSFIGEAYQWYLNDNIIEGATSSSVNLSGAGFYTVLVTVSDECSVESDNIFIPLNTINLTTTDVEFYPNPFSDFLTVIIPSSSDEIDIYDLSGKLVFTQKTNSARQQHLDLCTLASGSYFITVVGDNGTSSKAIFKD